MPRAIGSALPQRFERKRCWLIRRAWPQNAIACVFCWNSTTCLVSNLDLHALFPAISECLRRVVRHDLCQCGGFRSAY